MAIKGKRKPKSRAGRVVTPGPRPAYVPPKVPLFQRTGAKFLFVLVIELAFFALLVGFGEQSAADREKSAVKEFGVLVDSALAQAGGEIQPITGASVVLPQFQTTLNGLLGEEPLSPEDAKAQADAWAESLTTAADALSEVDVPDEGLEPVQVVALTEARTEMDRGLRMYVRLTDQFEVASKVEGITQQELITSINALLASAADNFDAGYGKLQDIRNRLGIPLASAQPPMTGLPSGIPGGGVPPIEIPAEEPVDDGGGGGGGGGGNGGGGNGGGNGGGGGQG
jgi:hypothetical protein